MVVGRGGNGGMEDSGDGGREEGSDGGRGGGTTLPPSLPSHPSTITTPSHPPISVMMVGEYY